VDVFSHHEQRCLDLKGARPKTQENERELSGEIAALGAINAIETEAGTRLGMRPGLYEAVRVPRLIMGKW